MFEQDYIMRLIKDAVKMAMKLIFHIEADNFSPYLIENPEVRENTEMLLKHLDNGNIRVTEQELLAKIKQNPTPDNLLSGLVFYSYLSDKDEEYLSAHNSTPEELKNGIKQLMSLYGMDSFAENFFFDI
ncbi:MAG: hypothetical protein IJJ69_07795 [Oscillospiraceae bacterium]|nr:hypothetical protein [Oscillospiraceae bacterium]